MAYNHLTRSRFPPFYLCAKIDPACLGRGHGAMVPGWRQAGQKCSQGHARAHVGSINARGPRGAFTCRLHRGSMGGFSPDARREERTHARSEGCERALRTHFWLESNEDKVERLSCGGISGILTTLTLCRTSFCSPSRPHVRREGGSGRPPSPPSLLLPHIRNFLLITSVT